MTATQNRWTATAMATLVVVYVSAYLFSTEVFHGRLGADRFRIRLFQSETHLRAFVPLLFMEGIISPRDREFSGQVFTGASLPPAE